MTPLHPQKYYMHRTNSSQLLLNIDFTPFIPYNPKSTTYTERIVHNCFKILTSRHYTPKMTISSPAVNTPYTPKSTTYTERIVHNCFKILTFTPLHPQKYYMHRTNNSQLLLNIDFTPFTLQPQKYYIYRTNSSQLL